MLPNRITFYDPIEQPYGDLSPYSLHGFFVEPDRMAWRSCQQYWLAQKFLDANRKESINQSKTLEEAQALAEQWAPRQDWDDAKDPYLQLANHAKFAENLHLPFLLAETGNAELIYADFDDPDWGTGPDSKGQNK